MSHRLAHTKAGSREENEAKMRQVDATRQTEIVEERTGNVCTMVVVGMIMAIVFGQLQNPKIPQSRLISVPATTISSAGLAPPIRLRRPRRW